MGRLTVAAYRFNSSRNRKKPPEKPMEILLYYAPTTCALAPYITLTEANAEFDVRPLNFRKKQNRSAEYLKINPKHKVPLLVVDGQPLTENVAIQIWISRTFPQAKLLPAEPWQELKAVSLLSWCSSGIHPYLSRINSPPKVCDLPDTADSVRRLAGSSLAHRERRDPDLDFAHFPASQTAARRALARIKGGFAALLVFLGHSPLSQPD